MKLNLVCLLAIAVLASCNGQDKPVTTMSEKTNQTNSNSNTVLSNQKACEAIPLATIAELMGIEQSAVIEEDMSFGKGRSMCYFYSKEGDRKVYIRMAWKNEKAEENKVLQQQFADALANGEKDIKSYTEVENSEHGQVLFGIGQDRENKYIHMLRKRYGNKAEISLELLKENKDEMAQDILMKIMNAID